MESRFASQPLYYHTEIFHADRGKGQPARRRPQRHLRMEMEYLDREDARTSARRRIQLRRRLWRSPRLRQEEINTIKRYTNMTNKKLIKFETEEKVMKIVSVMSCRSPVETQGPPTALGVRSSSG